jgi:hypothetical protein
MNGKIKFHKATGPAFAPGEVWVSSSGARVEVISVRKYLGAIGDRTSDFGVTYYVNPGVTEVTHEKDCWNFQVRYTHNADLKV